MYFSMNISPSRYAAQTIKYFFVGAKGAFAVRYLGNMTAPAQGIWNDPLSLCMGYHSVGERVMLILPAPRKWQQTGVDVNNTPTACSNRRIHDQERALVDVNSTTTPPQYNIPARINIQVLIHSLDPISIFLLRPIMLPEKEKLPPLETMQVIN